MELRQILNKLWKIVIIFILIYCLWLYHDYTIQKERLVCNSYWQKQIAGIRALEPYPNYKAYYHNITGD